jgi:hypothetical protein
MLLAFLLLGIRHWKWNNKANYEIVVPLSDGTAANCDDLRVDPLAFLVKGVKRTDLS